MPLSRPICHRFMAMREAGSQRSSKLKMQFSDMFDVKEGFAARLMSELEICASRWANLRPMALLHNISFHASGGKTGRRTQPKLYNVSKLVSARCMVAFPLRPVTTSIHN